jgi:triosephosphate isomerase
MARRQIVAGNWKMNMTRPEAVKLAEEVVAGVASGLDREVVLCPAYIAMACVADKIKGVPVHLGAQNCHWEESGAYTGEISTRMLSQIGCRFVIIGHSERRALFGETDEEVEKKLHAVAGAGMIPILCVGETLEQREAGDTEAVVMGQLKGALGSWKSKNPGEMVIAYEPVWAIGTGKTATPDQADEVHGLIRLFLAGALGEEVSSGTMILYGGSVKPGNAAELFARENIDGALVGGASLDAGSFLGICKA